MDARGTFQARDTRPEGLGDLPRLAKLPPQNAERLQSLTIGLPDTVGLKTPPRKLAEPADPLGIGRQGITRGRHGERLSPGGVVEPQVRRRTVLEHRGGEGSLQLGRRLVVGRVAALNQAIRVEGEHIAIGGLRELHQDLCGVVVPSLHEGQPDLTDEIKALSAKEHHPQSDLNRYRQGTHWRSCIPVG